MTRYADLSPLSTVENLRPGDPCEFRYPARTEWQPGTVIRNGGYGYWAIRDEGDSEGKRGKIASALYIEHVRAPGTDPWGY